MCTTLSLVNLPAEVQLILLKRLPDIPTLLALISASPRFLHLYRRHRNGVFVSVVQNCMGWKIPTAMLLFASFKQSRRLNEGPNGLLTLAEAKLLYEYDATITALIQRCIAIQLGPGVQLSTLENTRMRRGMHNFIHAAALSRIQGASEHQPQVYEAFCESLTIIEVFEVLYILHCLQALAYEYYQRLSDFLYDQIMEGFIITDFELADVFFGNIGRIFRCPWFAHAPWIMDLWALNGLNDKVCETKYYGFDFHRVLDAAKAQSPHMLPEDTMRSQIPLDYEYPGWKSSDRSRWDKTPLRELFCNAIPSGFMIWDESRLAQMPWVVNSQGLNYISEHQKWSTKENQPWKKREGWAGLQETVETRVSEKYPSPWEMLNTEELYDGRNYPRGIPAALRNMFDRSMEYLRHAEEGPGW